MMIEHNPNKTIIITMKNKNNSNNSLEEIFLNTSLSFVFLFIICKSLKSIKMFNPLNYKNKANNICSSSSSSKKALVIVKITTIQEQILKTMT